MACLSESPLPLSICPASYSALALPFSFGPLAWAGIAGTEGLLHNIRHDNDMGHPLLGNIRAVRTHRRYYSPLPIIIK